MIKKLKEWGWGFLGFAMMCGFLVIGAILLVGVAKVSAILYPIFNALSAISLLLFFFIILPLSLINNARPFLAQASIVLSYICGAALWMYSFLVIFYILGWWALFLFFWFRAVTFVAAIGLFLKGNGYREGQSF